MLSKINFASGFLIIDKKFSVSVILDSSETYKPTLVIHLYGGNFNLYDSSGCIISYRDCCN